MRLTMFQPSVLALMVVAAAALQSSPTEYVSKEKGFAVAFPSPHKATPLAAPDGAVAMTQLVAELKTQAYVVVFVDWTAIDREADYTLDAQRDAMLAQVGAKLLSERYFALGGRPGREIRFDSATGVVVARLLFDQAAKRTFNVLSRRQRLDEGMAAAFFASFQLAEK